MLKGYEGLAISTSVGKTWALLTLSLVAVFTTSTATCGGFLKLTETSGSIQSPNYPNHYVDGTHCIWQLQAPKNNIIAMTVVAVNGQADSTGQCVDFVEIRNGSGTSPVVFRECVSSTPVSLSPSRRWVWVRFKTDYRVSNTGFQAIWTTVESNTTGDTINILVHNLTVSVQDVSPIPDCQPVKMRCANQECISLGYRCDDYNDCGCDGPGCDEYECGGFHWSQGTRLLVGLAIGVGFFSLVFFGVGFLEIFLKRRAETEYRRQVDDAKKRARMHRHRPAGGDSKVVPTSDGVKLDVPVKTPPGSSASSPAQSPRST